MDNFIKVYPFHLAPEEYKKLSDNGGDEDWIAYIPYNLVEEVTQYGLPSWIEKLGACDVQEVYLEDGSNIYIGSHS